MCLLCVFVNAGPHRRQKNSPWSWIGHCKVPNMDVGI